MSIKHDLLSCPLKGFTSKRKKSFIEREHEIMALAEQIMESDGFSALTMDKVVAGSSCSKGTVYNHFGSKEDLICGLCIKSMREMLVLFQRALTFTGNTREKMLACQFAYRLHAMMSPTLFLTVLVSKSPAILEKASAERIEEQRRLNNDITKMCDELVQSAVKCGDLQLNLGVGVDHLVFATWAMAFGTNSLLINTADVEAIDRLDKDAALLFNNSLLMDGMRWQPLSSEWDYQRTWERIATELFADEVARLKSKS